MFSNERIESDCSPVGLKANEIATSPADFELMVSLITLLVYKPGISLRMFGFSGRIEDLKFYNKCGICDG